MDFPSSQLCLGNIEILVVVQRTCEEGVGGGGSGSGGGNRPAAYGEGKKRIIVTL